MKCYYYITGTTNLGEEVVEFLRTDEDGEIWARNAEKVLVEESEALAAIEKAVVGACDTLAEDLLRNVLAIIHRDGGQRQNEEGTEATLEAVARAFFEAIEAAREEGRAEGVKASRRVAWLAGYGAGKREEREACSAIASQISNAAAISARAYEEAHGMTHLDVENRMSERLADDVARKIIERGEHREGE